MNHIVLHESSLEAIAGSVGQLRLVLRASLRAGDCLIVKTCNSTYLLHADDDGTYLVSGGWFDRKGEAPVRIRINGCTWGGSIIKTDTVAAVGLCVEFGNRVTTSPIQKVIFIAREKQN